MKDKWINDYFEQIYEKYPTISKKDIKRILKFGWKSVYLHNYYGMDVMIQDQELTCFMGVLGTDSLKHYERYAHKLKIKIKFLLRRLRPPMDEYYYFALNDASYERYTSQFNKRGPKRKKFKFGKVALFKYLDECKISLKGYRYLFRTKLPIDFGYYTYRENYITDQAELIEVRNKMTMNDLMELNKKYNSYGTTRVNKYVHRRSCYGFTPINNS